MDSELIFPIFRENLGDFCANHEIVVNTLPQYLNTYSLVGLPQITMENRKPQERLNRLLASNDPQFPRENTLLDWLNPVRQQQNRFGGVENMPEGFGPRIKF